MGEGGGSAGSENVREKRGLEEVEGRSFSPHNVCFLSAPPVWPTDERRRIPLSGGLVGVWDGGSASS